MSVAVRRRRCRENPRRGAWRGTVTSVTPLPPLTSAYLGPGDTSWTVPDGVTVLKRVIVWGAGADNGLSTGGGGTACSVRYNVPVTPGQVIPVSIPTHNTGSGDVYAWFDDISVQKAHSGKSGGGPGLASSSIGDDCFDGGTGGSESDGAGPAGGGAASPTAAGKNGGHGDGSQTGGGGGGGQGGGTDGSDGSPSPIHTGGLGGANADGAFYPAAGSGGPGQDFNNGDGFPGADDPDGGGGGGGGANRNTGSGKGGAGGQPGGGAGLGSPEMAVAIGGDGAIKIEF